MRTEEVGSLSDSKSLRVNDAATAVNVVESALQAAGGQEALAEALRIASSETDVSVAIQAAGGPEAVSEALFVVSEALGQSESHEIRQALDAANGPDLVAEALRAAGGHVAVAEALSAAGGATMVAEALSFARQVRPGD